MFRRTVAGALLCVMAAGAAAGLFDDEEARRAILDLRQRIDLVRQSVDGVRLESQQGLSRANEDSASLRRSLLDLQNQIETLTAYSLMHSLHFLFPLLLQLLL